MVNLYKAWLFQALLLVGTANFGWAVDLVQTTTFTEFPETFKLYPRDLETNRGTVAIEGSITESGVDSIVVRVSRDGEPYAEQEVALSYENGAASFDLDFEIEAELADYGFEMRARQGAAELPVRSADRVVAGDIFLLNGQSNALAFAATIDDLASPTESGPFLRSYGSNSADGDDVLETLIWLEASGDFSGGEGYVGQWGLRLGRLLVDAYKLPVAIVSGADSGREIPFFQRNDEDPQDVTTNYGRLLTRAIQGGFVDQVRAFLWWQGENDYVRPEQHRPGFLALREDWAEDYPSLEKIYLWQVRTGCSNNNVRVADIQRRLAQELPDVELMTASGVDGQDGCHYYWENGYKLLGERLFPLVARDLYGATETENIEPPMIAQAYFALQDPSTVTLVMEDTNDTLRWDTGAGADFRFEGAQVRAISGEVAGNTVTLRLDGDASAATGITYLGHIMAGPWLTNASGVGIASFFDFPIDPQPPGSPTITASDPQINLLGDAVSVTVNAADPNGVPLVYEASGLPPGLEIDRTSGVISGTLGADRVGVYAVTVSVNNGVFQPIALFDWTVTSSASSPLPPGNEGLRLWLDANDSATLTQNGGRVAAWRDKSPNQFEVGQADASRQPQLAVVQDQAAVRFSEALLSLPGGVFDTGGTIDELTIFVEMRHGAEDELGTLLYESVGGVGESVLLQLPWSTARHFDVGDASDGRLAIYDDVIGTSDFQTYRAESFVTNDGGEQRLLRNGQLVGSDTSAVSFEGIGRPFFLGSAGDSVYQTFDLRELIIYTRRLSEEEIALVEAYLELKWNGAIGTPDTQAPSITLSTTTVSTEGNFTVQVSADELIGGLTASDFAITNGEVVGLSGGGRDYQLAVAPFEPGDVVLTLPADVVTDLAGNGNAAANVISVVYDPGPVDPGPVDPGPGGEGTIPQTDLLLWLDASDAGSFAIEGGNVINWGDRSSSAHVAELVTSSTPPRRIVGGDGLPAVQFDGSAMVIPSGIVGDGRRYEDLAVFLVVRHGRANETGTLFFEGFGDAFNHILLQMPWGEAIHVDGGNDGVSRLALYNPQLDTNTFQRYRLESFVSGGPFQGLYRNGEIIASDDSAQAFVGSGNGFYLGSAGGDFYQTFDLKEIIIYARKPAATEIQEIEDYLEEKWFDGGTPNNYNDPPAANLAARVATTSGAFTVDVSFDETVEGLDADSFDVVNGSVSDVLGNADSYEVRVVPDGNGAITLRLRAGVVSDLAGNLNLASNQVAVAYESSPPPLGDDTIPQQDLLLWLDASDLGSLNVDAGRVAEWRDRSNNGHVAEQLNPELQPQFVTAEDGLPAIQFQENTLFIPEGIVGEGVRYSDLVVYLVVRQEASYELGTLFYERFQDAFSHILLQMPWGDALHFDGGGDSDSRLASYGLQIQSTDFHRYRAESFATGEPFQGFYRDDVLLAEDETAVGFTGEGNRFYLGSAGDGFFQSFDLREMIIYARKPASSEVAAIESYLDSKWRPAVSGEIALSQSLVSTEEEAHGVTIDPGEAGELLVRYEGVEADGRAVALEVSSDLIHWTRVDASVESELLEDGVRQFRFVPERGSKAKFLRVAVEY